VEYVAALGKTRSWDAFAAWCDARGLAAAPANPWTLAAYIRAVENAMRYDALKRHVDQIGQMHFEQRRTRPDRDVMVKRLLDAARRREEAKKRAQEKAKEKPAAPPLFDADDFLAAKTPKTPKTPKPRTKPGAAAKPRALRVTPKLVRRKRV